MPTLLKSILNLRDVGAVVNDYTSQELLDRGKFYRSARPDECSIADRERLINELGVKSIIDLRTKTEHIEQAKKRDAKIHSSELVPQSNDDVAEPLKAPGITYHEINFNGSAYTWALLNKLSWWNYFRLLGLMAAGYRKEAISIIATNVLQPRGLVGLAIDSIELCWQEVLQVFSVLADEDNFPLVIHCTQGKDRTGLTVMLCLLLLGVPPDAIEHDYLLTRGELDAEKEERLREIRSIGLGEEFGECSANMISKVNEHIGLKYGGIEQYLESVGVDKDMQMAVRRVLRSA